MSLDATLQGVLDQSGFRSNPYFISLEDGSFEFDDFVETQIQFYYCVLFFPRPMAAVAAKIPDPELRVEVVRNVWEEHGEGETARMHGATFREFMVRLAGITRDRLDSMPLWPEARLFNTALAGVGVLDEYLVSVATLGTIEAMFSELSGRLGRAIVERGWLAPDRMVHYNLHEGLDVKHARDFFDVLETTWDEDPASRYYITQGMWLGACAFDELYRGLHRSRTRRWEPVERTFHSRA